MSEQSSFERMLSTGLCAMIFVITTTVAVVANAQDGTGAHPVEDGCDMASASACIKEQTVMEMRGDLFRSGSGSKEKYCNAVDAYTECSERNKGRCAGVDRQFKKLKAEHCQSVEIQRYAGSRPINGQSGKCIVDGRDFQLGLTLSFVLVAVGLFLSSMTTM